MPREFLKFRDLPIGTEFCFASEEKISGLAKGPWVKTSPRRYRHLSDKLHSWYGGEIRVGSIRAEVYTPVR
jgi:hypothetical protein